ncbi:MAG: toprim domain-containing protein [Nevskia sp.]|nr:toprim domain-containing protein [Nevskia sp.]
MAAPVWSTGRPDTSTSDTHRYRTLASVEIAFRDAMHAAGLVTDAEIVADGVLHRFHGEGDKHGTRNGWYVLHFDGVPAGAFGHWRTGACSTWRADVGRTLTRAELAAHRKRMTAARALRDAEHAREQLACRQRAATLWRAAGGARGDHPYLRRKDVGTHALRQRGDLLIVPVTDVAGTLHGLQFIAPDGGKRFLTATAKAGCFYLLGSPPQAAGEVLAIAEGYATAATIHAAAGWSVACAFDAGNLEPVARAVVKVHPTARFVICADNDTETPGNPGLCKARRAAAAVSGVIVYPNFNDGDTGTDWNDYAASYGIAAAREALLSALEVRRVA